ncbi:hypothetical protein L486_06561 [Kwoniella mangroviensis CBS 10435]|uniref:Bola-like protein n=1 Tax=Kwoniella mangroviensis CBS 10435 TaxID=1331196 RepID=A0A1B9IJF3_9TREE|nr:hypothetical protein L486_06561 [Kwoniella mangroviensis CBS 10435]OCF71696.1 hypothetical protein I204_07758 [Kwoniella mangroviensis CBS 8886]
MFSPRLSSLLNTSTVIPRSSTLASSSSRIIQTRFQFRSYSTPTPTPPLDKGEQAIYDKLKSAFPGQRLEVQDVSGGCGSFYAILISSNKFKGLSTIKQHKLVNACLKEDIQGIHGLQVCEPRPLRLELNSLADM